MGWTTMVRILTWGETVLYDAASRPTANQWIPGAFINTVTNLTTGQRRPFTIEPELGLTTVVCQALPAISVITYCDLQH
jgi:hypothetical protein